MKTLILILLIAGVAYLAFRFLTGQKYKKSLFGTQKISDQSREVPLGGNVFANWWVEEHALFLSLRSKKNERNLLTAFILKWILEGKIDVIPDARSKRRVSMGRRVSGTMPAASAWMLLSCYTASRPPNSWPRKALRQPKTNKNAMNGNSEGVKP